MHIHKHNIIKKQIYEKKKQREKYIFLRTYLLQCLKRRVRVETPASNVKQGWDGMGWDLIRDQSGEN